MQIATDLFFWHIDPGIATKQTHFEKSAATRWALPVSKKINGTNETLESLEIWEYFVILSMINVIYFKLAKYREKSKNK